jgi:hypothetical protein
VCAIPEKIDKSAQNEAIVWKEKGNIFYKQKNYTEALFQYNQGLQTDPNNPDIWYNKSVVLRLLGRAEEAKECEEKVIVLESRSKVESKPPSEVRAEENFKAEIKTPEKSEVQLPKENKTETKSIFSFVKKPLNILDSVGGALKTGSRSLAHKNLVRTQNNHIKKLIIQEFDLRELMKMCLYFNVGKPHPVGYNSKDELVFYKPEHQDWAKHAFKRISLEQLKEYAKKKNKLPFTIVDLEKKYKLERLEKYPEYETDERTVLSVNSSIQYDEQLVEKLIEAIEEFKPVKFFKNEELYHTNLYTYLCEKIPGEIGFEEQRGRSRPDIVVGDIAIEVKGPTDSQGLVTIADKINRYSQHFDYIIVVLFDVEVFEKFYQEWHEGIMRQYEGQVTIIRKFDVRNMEKTTDLSMNQSPKNQPSEPLNMNCGYCIRCRVEISRNTAKPLCEKCYVSWVRYSNERYPENYCHICGTKSKQSYSKPVCYSCWEKYST